VKLVPQLACGLCLALAIEATAQAPKPNKPKKGDDLPDVALQIPEDTRPEVKALLKANALGLSSSKASERAKAATVLGELREQGRPARGLLCRAMLDPSPTVRVAAADSLKEIDPKIQYLAVGLVTDEGPNKRYQLLSSITRLEDDGEPLAPLVANGAVRSASANNYVMLQRELQALGQIARNDLGTCRMIVSALASRDEGVRHTALQALARMKHARQSLSKIIAVLKADTPRNRIAAIQTLTALADESNEEAVVAAIASQRYHDTEAVRKAVEIALNKLQATKKTP
jgi:HEAT repeat protein